MSEKEPSEEEIAADLLLCELEKANQYDPSGSTVPSLATIAEYWLLDYDSEELKATAERGPSGWALDVLREAIRRMAVTQGRARTEYRLEEKTIRRLAKIIQNVARDRVAQKRQSETKVK
jgi:hypothetical protein